MREKPKVSFHTFGCRLNQAETAIIGQNFVTKGYELVDSKKTSDVCVVNTCTVTNRSDSDARKFIRGVLRQSPDTFIAVIGCYAETGAEEIRQIEGVDLILGTQEKMNVAKYIDETPGKRSEPLVIRKPMTRNDFTIEGYGDYNGQTRANLKIQDGCDFMCTFCIIPFARGRARSRKLDDIRREAEQLISLGHHEIILTGVNIGTYQSERYTFIDVIDTLEEIKELKRIRISSIEPTTIPRELIDRMADSDKLCPHFHIPLQSGDDNVLQAMKRKHRMTEYEDFIYTAVEKIPGLGLGTDIMVGFPGEDEIAFQNSFRAIEDLPFSYIHVFSYSERKGTPSVKYDNKAHSKTIKERSFILRKLGQKKKDLFYRTFVGKTVNVLFETKDEFGFWNGYTDNYIRVGVKTGEQLDNQIYPVYIDEVIPNKAIGRIVEKGKGKL